MKKLIWAVALAVAVISGVGCDGEEEGSGFGQAPGLGQPQFGAYGTPYGASNGMGWGSSGGYAGNYSSGEWGGANGAYSHTSDFGGGRTTIAGDANGGGVMVDGACVTWGW